MIFNKETVDVTIVSANFNKGEYIYEYFESILNSSVLPNEIIFIDDASTDNSLDKIGKYKHLKFLKIISLNQNHGFAKALNIGIKTARSEYIMRLDPDDFITKYRIKEQFHFLKEHPHISILGSNAFYYNHDRGKNIFVTKFPIKHTDIKKSFLKGDNGILHSTVMGRAEVFKDYKYEQKNYPAEDYDIFARMIKNGVIFETLPEPLTYYRIYEGNTSYSRLELTIKKTLNLREKTFQISANRVIVWNKYQHLLWYRRFLLRDKSIFKYLYLFIALIFRPDKLKKRIHFKSNNKSS